MSPSGPFQPYPCCEKRPLSSSGVLLSVLCCSLVWAGFVCIWYLDTGRSMDSIRIIKKVDVKRWCLLRSCS